jgi:single-strand DNA-binding protein
MSFNKITVVGNLGKDPELRYTPQGNAVANLSVATTEKVRDKSGEKQDVTTWFRCTVWAKQAENCAKYLSKGDPVYLEGRLRTEEWTDNEGKNRTTLEVNVSDVQFLGTRREFGNDTNNNSNVATASAGSGDTDPFSVNTPPAPDDDDIPF